MPDFGVRTCLLLPRLPLPHRAKRDVENPNNQTPNSKQLTVLCHPRGGGEPEKTGFPLSRERLKKVVCLELGNCDLEFPITFHVMWPFDLHDLSTPPAFILS